MDKTDRIIKAAYDVRRAIRDEGRAPDYHRRIMAKHQREWPTLWRGLAKLMEEIESVDWPNE